MLFSINYVEKISILIILVRMLICIFVFNLNLGKLSTLALQG